MGAESISYTPSALNQTLNLRFTILRTLALILLNSGEQPECACFWEGVSQLGNILTVSGLSRSRAYLSLLGDVFHRFARAGR